MEKQSKEERKIFYRNLFTPDHIKLWERGIFKSCHHREIPDEWVKKRLDGSQNIDDYPLKTSNGYYSTSARNAFFEHCVKGGKDAHTLDGTVKDAISELGGVCAYDNQAGVYWYGDVKPEPGHSLVAFYGNELCRLKSEANGGVVAEVMKPIDGPMTADEFVAKFCGGTPPEKPAGLPQNVVKPAEYYDDGVIEDAPTVDIRHSLANDSDPT